MINYLALVAAIAIAGVAAWYSITGLIAIFAAAAIPIAIMGIVLEAGKLITASWLFRNWEHTPFLLKSYLTTAVVVLMFITSLGIFGYLSKAHIDQGVGVNDSIAKIERLTQRIEAENVKIKRSEDQISSLDQALDKFIELGAVSKSLKAREDQKPERDALDIIIKESYNQIDKLNEEIATLKQDVRAFEVEVGPIKYVAELLYENPDLEGATRAIIIVLIFVFDPLAVLLLIAANLGLKREHERRVRQRANQNRKTDSILKKKGVLEIDTDSIMRMK